MSALQSLLSGSHSDDAEPHLKRQQHDAALLRPSASRTDVQSTLSSVGDTAREPF